MVKAVCVSSRNAWISYFLPDLPVGLAGNDCTRSGRGFLVKSSNGLPESVLPTPAQNNDSPEPLVAERL